MIRIAVCDDEQCFVEQIYTILSVQAKEISSALHISTYMDSGSTMWRTAPILTCCSWT